MNYQALLWVIRHLANGRVTGNAPPINAAVLLRSIKCYLGSITFPARQLGKLPQQYVEFLPSHMVKVIKILVRLSHCYRKVPIYPFLQIQAELKYGSMWMLIVALKIVVEFN